jgi:glyoxylase-like metal-dependent hydrolase (beta-lactamase superfamily II)
MGWQILTDEIWMFQDSCNVYAVTGPEGVLIIDAGTGAWLDEVDSLPGPPVALLLTHFFRDHTAGAAQAARQGIPVYVPEYEFDILTNPLQHFQERETYIIYDNLWDLFAPIEPVDAAGPMLDYTTASIAGIQVTSIPLPGATPSQTGYGMTLAGKRVVFCGETIHSPGKIARVAPLQYNYNDLSGAINCQYSAQTLREHDVDILLPSLGEPICQQTHQALTALEENLAHMAKGRIETEVAAEHEDRLIQISDHVWRSGNGVAHTHFVISESGKAMSIDYGYMIGWAQFPGYSRPARRRALLHGLKELQQRFGIDRIDMVLVSHFHDDHVAGIPVLQRLFGTECWAAENFADLLEHPDAHCFPCTWPKPIRVDRRLPLDQVIEWEEYSFHLAPMNGHTRFASLIGFEADGLRFAHTGDQYMPVVDKNGEYDRFDGHNYVFRNGALLDGYQQSGQWLNEWRPEIVISGHWNTVRTNAKFFEDLDAYRDDYQQMHQRVMPLAEDESHFNIDSWGGWIWPYRTVLDQPRETTLTVHVRNPYPREEVLEIRLVGPSGWEGSSATVKAPPRAEVSCTLSITPGGPCRRQPFAVELTAGGQRFGQVAEALMTVGSNQF